MHICFHMFLFVWCRISLVVSVQPIFSISKFWIIYTNSSFTFAHFHDQFLCAQCRKESSRCFLPAAMITTISESVLHQNEFHNRFIGFSPILFHLHFYTTILSHSNFSTTILSHSNFLTTILSHLHFSQQFFHFFSQQFFCVTTDQLRARVVSELSAVGADRSHFRVSFSHRNIIQPEDWIGSVINIRRVRIPCEYKRLCIKSLPHSMTKTRRNPN